MYSDVDVGAWNSLPQEGIKDKSAELACSVASVKKIMKVAEKAMEYVKMVDSPNLKVLLDTYHMNIWDIFM